MHGSAFEEKMQRGSERLLTRFRASHPAVSGGDARRGGPRKTGGHGRGRRKGDTLHADDIERAAAGRQSRVPNTPNDR